MKRFFLATMILLGGIYAASAQFNGCQPGFCPGIFGGGGTITPSPTGDILLVDGVSLLLQTDAASFVCKDDGVHDNPMAAPQYLK